MEVITLEDRVMLYYCEKPFLIAESEERDQLLKLLSAGTYPGLIRLLTTRGVISFNLSSHVPFRVEFQR